MQRILYSLSGASGQHYSPHVWKIIKSLKHKGLAFDLKPVSFGDIASIEDGSYSRVPVLNDQGTLLGDSFKIELTFEKAGKTEVMIPVVDRKDIPSSHSMGN